MKKAPNVRLSLRKLLVAMLAVGPIAILPSPVMAVIPTAVTTNVSTDILTANTIIVTNGSASLSGSTATVANISTSDKAVLVWTKGSFNIGLNETYSFQVPGGSVLNKVGYRTNGSTQDTKDNVTIAGSLNSNGRVFVLVNGDISVNSGGAGSVINTTGGLYLSTTQQDTTDGNFNFITQGIVSSNGTSLGNITVGGATPLSVTGGSLEVVAGSITANGATMSAGDLILRPVTANQAIALGAMSNITVNGGNLVVSTVNGNITNTNPIIVNNSSKSVSLTSGTANVTLSGANDISTINVSANNSTVAINEANGITLGNVAVGSAGSLTVTTSGGIATSGAVTGNSATLTAAGDVTIANGSAPTNLTINTTGGNISVSTSGNLTLGGVSTTGNGIITVSSTGSLTANGTITAPANVSLTGTSVTETTTGNISGSTANTNLSASATSGSVTLGNITARAVNVTSTGGSISQTANTTLTLGNLTASSFNAGSTGSVSLTNNNVLNNGQLTLTGGTVQVSSVSPFTVASANTTGGLTLSTINAPSTMGNITLGAGSGSASPSINVGGGLSITTNNSTVTDDDDLAINVFGAVTLNTATNNASTGNVTLDSAVGSSGRGSATFGQITANTGNSSITIHERTTVNFGAVNAFGVTANSISGSILLSGAFTALSNVTLNANTGGISQTAPVSLVSGVNHEFRVSNNFSTVLDNPSNSFGSGNFTSGRVLLNGGANNIVVANSNFRFGGGAASTVNTTINTTAAGQSVTIVQNNTTTGVGGNNIVINSAGPISVQTTSGIRNLTLNTTDTSANSITSSGNGNLTVNGTLTLTSSGGVTLTGATANNGMTVTGNVVLANVVGDVLIQNQRNLTLTGSSTQANVTAVAGYGPFANNGWTLSLGNLNVRSLTANVVNGEFSSANVTNALAGGASGNIVQLPNSRVHVENAATFVTFNGGNIVLGNNGNNFSRVNAYTGGAVGATTNNSGNVTIWEDGTLKVGTIITSGNVSLQSRFGSVIEDTAVATNLTIGGVLSATSPSSSVLLGGTTTALTTGTVGSFNVTAPNGAVAIRSNGSISIGATAANSLAIRSGDSISQSGPLNIFGAASFNATNTITLNDAANNFGPVTLISGNASSSISLTETNTVNLRSVTVPGASTGSFTITSVNGGIVDTGLGGVKVGGVVGSSGTGVVTLSATNGDIMLDDPTTDFPTTGGVAFNAKNVTFTLLGAGATPTALILGAANQTSVATGNLSATSFLGNITSAGNLNVTGVASFNANSNNVVINQTGNQFGSVRFRGNQINIVESNDTVLLTDSTAIGSALIRSGGNLTVNSTSGGTISFGSFASLEAGGTITLPKVVQAVNTLSVNAPGTKDLSALSVSADLNGKDPINLGTGTYRGPGQ